MTSRERVLAAIEHREPDRLPVGFVFCQVHNIQAGTRPESIEGMYQAVRDHGEY